METSMKWVDVGDELPVGWTYVLVCMSTGLVTATFYAADKNFFTCDVFGETDEVSANFKHAREYGYRVTHWMPLPSPPVTAK